MTSPFEYNFCNRLCFVWLTATLLTLVSALLFHSPGLAERDRLAYAVFLLIIVIFAIVVTIYVVVREVRFRIPPSFSDTKIEKKEERREREERGEQRKTKSFVGVHIGEPPWRSAQG